MARKTIHRENLEHKSFGDLPNVTGVERYQLKARRDDNVATVIHKIPVAELEGVHVEVTGFGLRSTAGESIRTKTYASYRRAAGGNVTATIAATTVTGNDSAGTPVIALVANTSDQTVDIAVTGENTKDIIFLLDVSEMKIKF